MPKKKTNQPKPPKALTLEERSKLDDEMYKQGGRSMIVIQDGKKYTVEPDGSLKPVTGSQAQAAVKKQRKGKA